MLGEVPTQHKMKHTVISVLIIGLVASRLRFWHQEIDRLRAAEAVRVRKETIDFLNRCLEDFHRDDPDYDPKTFKRLAY